MITHNINGLAQKKRQHYRGAITLWYNCLPPALNISVLQKKMGGYKTVGFEFTTAFSPALNFW
ncbi:MAG TPA: hypothetical protein DIW24_01495 [Bacteroidetes bacterium]|nr:hypothetical protein [Bacteroidota bacterium]